GIGRPAARSATADQARSVIGKFLTARAAGDRDGARGYLDGRGRKAFGDDKLLFKGGAQLTRWFVVFVQPRDDGSATAFVRPVLTGKKGVEERQLDELLTLQPATDGSLLIHDVVAGKARNVDAGPEVVSVTAAP